MPRQKPTPQTPLRVELLIQEIRGEKVILDTDLARIYGVTPKRLNEQVKRNRERFPSDFVFQLTTQEFDILRSRSATSNSRATEKAVQTIRS